MTYRINCTSVVLMALVLTGPAVAQVPDVRLPAVVAKSLATRQATFFASSANGPVLCKPDCTGANVVPVSLKEGWFIDDATAAAVKSCVVNVNSEVHLAGKSQDRTIVWQLILPANPVATYRFHQTSGIADVGGDKDQISKKGIGDGATSNTLYFYVKHTNRKNKGTIDYYPLVEQVLDGVVSLCAASDPKITNDGP